MEEGTTHYGGFGNNLRVNIKHFLGPILGAEVAQKCAPFLAFFTRTKPTFDFIQKIFSHADSFEVLEPLFLRKQIADMAYNMTKYYSDQTDSINE